MRISPEQVLDAYFVHITDEAFAKLPTATVNANFLVSMLLEKSVNSSPKSLEEYEAFVGKDSSKKRRGKHSTPSSAPKTLEDYINTVNDSSFSPSVSKSNTPVEEVLQGLFDNLDVSDL